MFPSVPPTTDQHQFRNQKISTRLFIVILLLSLTILLLYNSLVSITKEIIVNTPMIDEYSQLYVEHARTLTCPCTKISVDHHIFIDLTYTFHQVCHSAFVTSHWLDYLNAAWGSRRLNENDFRIISISHFQFLSALCELANRTISDSLIEFYSTQYVAMTLTPRHLFEVQMDSSIDQYILSTTNSFLLSMRIVREIAYGNSFLSTRFTNGYFLVKDYNDWVRTVGKEYENCSCDSGYDCRTALSIYNRLVTGILFTVPGIYQGCYIVESLLDSTLECFYNQSCFDQLIIALNVSWTLNVSILNVSLPSRFLVKSTVKAMVDGLMVEKWNRSLVFEKYYDACQPTECRYTITSRNDVLYIVTTLLGLVGGLVSGLQVMIPRIVAFVYYIIRQRMRVSPQ
ncbi:unnamed protein product [Adineta ricciae]|uniref:Uncharacterized protein n=1 Tax=Adineta ricciae TaxID=249248 RepID=A0A815J715_ADIRI|nr:unnamed protein product [Adineta ricciae]